MIPLREVCRRRPNRRWLLLGLLVLLSGLPLAAAAAGTGSTASTPVIETSEDFWYTHANAGDREFPLRAELGIHCYDPEWKVLWVDWGGAGAYLHTGKHVLPFRSGQRVRLEGYARPGRQEILWDRTTIHVLEPAFAPEATPLPDPLADPRAYTPRFVLARGLVTTQQDADSTHLQLTLVGTGWTILVQLLIAPNQPVPQLAGAFVAVRGVFSARSDAAENPEYDLWVARPEHIAVESWLAEDRRFDLPRTPLDQLARMVADRLVHVQGSVHAQEPGKSLTIRDDTGQVQLLTRQTEVLKPGQVVEAVGYPDGQGIDVRLRQSLYRSASSLPSDSSVAGAPAVARSRLRLTDQIRQLPPNEARRGYPVELRAVVTWSDPAQRTCFVRDATGGIKVLLPDNGSVPPPEFARDYVVTGVTEPGEFAPVVRAQRFAPGYGVTLPPAQPVTLRQALTGATYAEWTEFHGYVRSAVMESHDLARIELTTPTGELAARVRGLEQPQSLIGARVQVRGVCDALVNERRQLIGVQLWVPSATHVRVLEPAPQDVFTTPLRSIGSLLQFGAASEYDHRVRLTGTVALHRPGTLLYIEDAEDRLLVLSRAPEPLQPGDVVEVVGFPGHEGVRLIMRDAVYRRIGQGSPPIPTRLETPGAPTAKLDGNTVTLRGRLLDQVASATGIVLQIQSGPAIFPARWSGSTLPSVETGSLVDVTGVYRVGFDEYRRPDGFVLELRRADDLRVIEQPPWWTTSRIATALATLFGGTALSIIWLVALMRRNQLLRAAKAELRRANTELEARVQERTRALQLEIEERQNSEDILAEERQMLRTLIDNLPLYLYVKNANGRFVISNLPHAQLLGADSGMAVVGRSDFDLYPDDLARRYREDDQRVLKSGVPLILHEEPSQVRGLPGWFATTKVPLRNRHGQIVGLIGVSQDITERKRAEVEREALQRQLLESSRRAGMAEVATGILHNVGNVLNSVNVSATLAVERVRESKVGKLLKLAELLQSQAQDLPAFFASDPRGARIPGFVESLGKELAAEQTLLLEELDHLWRNVDHIKDIVAMQQSYATVSGAIEKVDLADLADDALRMNAGSFARHDVAVVRDYAARPTVHTERHKIMQILVNFIRNAKQACDATSRRDKKIIVRIREQLDQAEISVTDNGVGIPAENLTRIFSHGFTTKRNGHGFGLHSGALAAKELGAALRCESAGTGQGATFTLTIPIDRPADVRGTPAPTAPNEPRA